MMMRGEAGLPRRVTPVGGLGLRSGLGLGPRAGPGPGGSRSLEGVLSPLSRWAGRRLPGFGPFGLSSLEGVLCFGVLWR